MTPVKVVGAFTECVKGTQESSALTRKTKRSRQSQPLPTQMARFYSSQPQIIKGLFEASMGMGCRGSSLAGILANAGQPKGVERSPSI